MAYIGTSISTTPTLTGVAAVDITNGGGLAVKYNTEGKIVLCSVPGEAALGLIILQTNDIIKAGESLTIQISAQGKGIAGAAVKHGDALTVNASGKLVKAAIGNSVVGMALSKSVADGLVNLFIDRTIAIV